MIANSHRVVQAGKQKKEKKKKKKKRKTVQYRTIVQALLVEIVQNCTNSSIT
jgi:hypothetical protein